MRPRVQLGFGLLVFTCALSGAGLVLAKPTAHEASAATSRRIVALAQRELRHGVHEIPDGSNRAPAIRRYETATAGAAYGAPWCAYFVSYVAKLAGVPIGPGGRGLGYVPYIRAWAHQTGRWTTRPRPGELITFPQHVGIVETVYSNHTMTTIEGNHGNAVTRVYRRWSEAMGYVRLGGGNPKPIAPARRPALPKAPARKLPRLRARITAYPGTAIAGGQSITFSSDDSSRAPTRSDWDLDGNGKMDAHGDNVTRTYKTAGTFKVRLVVRDEHGRRAVATQKVLVRPNVAPVASFSVSADNVMVGDAVTADASASHDPDGRIVSYEWDLDGNGDWGTDGVRHSFRYTVAGDYYAGLRVTDDDGNVTEVHVPIHVADAPSPVSRISCDNTSPQTRETIHCSADDSDSPTRIVRHDWDFDDDGRNDARGSSASWTYKTAGTYTVHLTVTDTNGHTQQSTVDVHVANRPPIVRLVGPSRLTVGQSAQYDAARSTDVDGKVTGFAWVVQDALGSPPLSGSGAQLTFAPSTPGIYALRVAVSDDSGDSAEADMTVRVTGEAPTAQMAALTGPVVAGQPTTLDASGSSSPYGALATYEWDLDGDRTYETTGATPTWTPAQAGGQRIRLRVTDAYGATATTSMWVRVAVPPDDSSPGDLADLTPPTDILAAPVGGDTG